MASRPASASGTGGFSSRRGRGELGAGGLAAHSRSSASAISAQGRYTDGNPINGRNIPGPVRWEVALTHTCKHLPSRLNRVRPQLGQAKDYSTNRFFLQAQGREDRSKQNRDSFLRGPQ